MSDESNADSQQQLNDQIPVVDEHFSAGYAAGQAEMVDRLKRETPFSAGFTAGYEKARAELTTQQINEDFIAETVEWAKTEWPMLKDAVDARIKDHQPKPPASAIFMRGLTGLVLVRLADFLERAGVAEVTTELKHAMDTIQFYSEQFTITLQGTGLLTGDEFELPPIAQGLSALRHLMMYKAEQDQKPVIEDVVAKQWAAVSNMMNEALAGQPEGSRTDIELLDRFSLLLERLKQESEKYHARDQGNW
jgi:hypothetical protein